MTDKVLSAWFKAELFIHCLHGILVQVNAWSLCKSFALCTSIYPKISHTLVSSRVTVLPALKKFEELLRPSFLKKAHQGTLDRLHLRARYLRDLPIPVDKAARNLFEI